MGEEQVGGEVEGSGEDAEYRVEEEEVEEDREKNQFSSVLSTLTFLQLDQTFENVTVSCRSMNHYNMNSLKTNVFQGSSW